MASSFLQITLPRRFQNKHRYAIERYLVNSKALLPAQWQVVIEAIDILRNATIRHEYKQQSFNTFYKRFVDNVYADTFLQNLLAFPNPERDGPQLQATFRHQIISQLRTSDSYDLRQEPNSLYLQAYCAFWWDSFAKGYTFEVAVFRDLHQSGINFVAHDLSQPEERYTPYDLIVSGWQGDIRTSTYFLATARTQLLTHDFYITRLWHSQRRKRVWTVIMQPFVWSAIDGDTKLVELSQASSRFPAVSQIIWRNRGLIVADYETWRAKIIKYQEQQNE